MSCAVLTQSGEYMLRLTAIRIFKAFFVDSDQNVDSTIIIQFWIELEPSLAVLSFNCLSFYYSKTYHLDSFFGVLLIPL